MDNIMMDGMSMDLAQEARERLQSVFPDCFAEGKLDIDKLLSLCGEYIDNDFEKYKFEWKGKLESLRLTRKRSTGTLRPCPEESVDFDNTENLYIEGDNLEVLKLLQTAYFRRVKMIYIDPPYNTGNDFVYEDDFKDPMARYKEITQQTTKSNPETMGRFHTNWLNMMYPRLRLAANLLRDDGVCFISIDDIELENAKKICNEVFGEENFVKCLVWKNRYGGGAKEKHIVSVHEYILVYAKSVVDMGELFVPLDDSQINKFYTSRDAKYNIRGPFRTQPMEAARTLGERPNLVYPIPAPDGTEIWPKRQWLWSKERTLNALKNDDLLITKNNDEWSVRNKQYLYDEDGTKRQGKLFSILDGFYTQEGSKEVTSLLGNPQIFSYPKPSSLVKELLKLGTSEDCIILDFFSGSATTAHAVMQLNAEDGGNRKFIMIQLPEACDEKSEAYKAGYKTICEIGKERIRRAGTNIKEEVEEANAQLKLGEEEKPFPDTGFKVFKLDTSNLKTWDGTPVSEEEVQLLFDRMNGMTHRVKQDRTDLDMVYEVMLKLGVPLTLPVTPVEINAGRPGGSKRAYSIREDAMLLVCLVEGITPEDVEALCDYAPAKIILAKSGLADDTAMSNAYYICRDRGIELKLV